VNNNNNNNNGNDNSIGSDGRNFSGVKSTKNDNKADDIDQVSISLIPFSSAPTKTPKKLERLSLKNLSQRDLKFAIEARSLTKRGANSKRFLPCLPNIRLCW
jgi:hypothetical protein